MRIFPYAMNKDAYSIDYEYLRKKGYNGIIFDIDNTLVEHNEPATEKAVVFFRRLHALGYKTAVVSNNKEPRVRAFAEKTGCGYVFKAGKPSSRGYIEAMNKMSTGKKDTFVVGDQLITDIWGANNTGLKSVMVRRIAAHEEIQIHLKRIPEAVIVWLYRLTHKNISEKELL